MFSSRMAFGGPAVLAALLLGLSGLAGCATDTVEGDYEADVVISEEDAIPDAELWEDEIGPGFGDGAYYDGFGAAFGNGAYDDDF